MDDVVADCSELYVNPVRTGIQRVVRQMLRHWPAAGPRLHPARFDGSGLVRLSDRAIRLLTEQEPSDAELPYREVKRRLEDVEAASTTGRLPDRAVALIPEVFFDPARARFHVQRARADGRRTPLAMLAYDFLPFLQPGLFHLRSAAPLMGYLEAVCAAHSVAHISEQTRRDYVTRIMRGAVASAGPVLPLGFDGLAVERQTWSAERRSIVCLGSIDGRKNQHVVAAGFMSLWRAGIDAPLVLIGRAFEGVDRGWLREAEAFAQFRWLEDASDADIAHELRQARATIYASTSEGFGLPPVESLGVGVPVIAWAKIPSLEMMSSHGQLQLVEMTPRSVAESVAAILNDTTARRLWAEAASLKLNSWKNFAEQTAEWLARLAVGSATCKPASRTSVKPAEAELGGRPI